MKFNVKSILATGLLLVASAAQASETISIVWGFNIGSNQAVTIRHMVEEANQIQNKYTFILESKPGAGGSIAANHVAQNSSNSLVGMSSSFFIRPSVETQGIHDLDQFRPVLVQGTGAPLALVSKNYRSVDELLKQPSPSIGISGVGSISDMLASALKEKNPNLTVVNYKGMVDATVAAAGGHVDAAVTFVIDAKSLLDGNQLAVIGYTGSKDIDGKGLLLSKQGIKGVDQLTANYAVFSSVNMDPAKHRELNGILSQAAKSEKVQEAYKKDLLTVANVPYEKMQGWYDSERSYWKTTANKLIKK